MFSKICWHNSDQTPNHPHQHPKIASIYVPLQLQQQIIYKILSFTDHFKQKPQTLNIRLISDLKTFKEGILRERSAVWLVGSSA